MHVARTNIKNEGKNRLNTHRWSILKLKMSLSPASFEPGGGQQQRTSSQPTTHTSRTSTTTGENGGKVQIFLGGSCNPTTWRQTVAIPFLELNGITYYNPQVDNWTPEVVNVERNAKKNADWLLFVIDKQTRSTVSLIESAFMAGDGKRLVLVIYPFDYSIDHLSIQSDTRQTSNVIETHEETRSTTSHTANSIHLQSSSSLKSSISSRFMTTSSSNFASGTIRVNGESISLGEFQELRQARLILQSLVSSQGIPIFIDIPQALRYVSDNLLSVADNNIITLDEQPSGLGTSVPSPRSRATIANSLNVNDISVKRLGDSYDLDNTLKDVYISLDDNGDSNFESAVIPILKEKGLTFTYKPVSNITRFSTQKSPITTTQEISLAINELRASNRYSVEENEQKIIQESRLALEREMSAIRSSRVILVVITSKCRGLSIMVLASHFMALFRRNVVLCIQYLEDPCCVNGEILTKKAVADYNRGRVYLGDYAVESQVPVFGTIRDAVDCCSEKCGYNSKEMLN